MVKELKGEHVVNGTPYVYTSGMNFDEIGQILYKYIGSDYTRFKYLNDDFSAFDSSQGQLCHDMEKTLFDKLNWGNNIQLKQAFEHVFKAQERTKGRAMYKDD